jgi:ABC-type lipoprotein release transport system permease subunit
MVLSLAWRNVVRNGRRSAFTGAAVAAAVILIGWLVGFTYGAYDKMIDTAVHTRTGHLQVMREGTLDQPDPTKIILDAAELSRRVSALDGVVAVSSRVLAEGLLVHDRELAPVDLIGVDPEAEGRVSTVPHRVMTGEKAVHWCGERMSGDERWCEATGKGEFLPAGKPEGVVLGSGVAQRLRVTVGDELSVQLARAGGPAERKLVITGIVAAGSPEIAERAAYLNARTLNDLLGTEGPTELAIVLRSIDDLKKTRDEVRGLLGPGLVVHTWAERNPTLSNLIEMMKAGRVVFFALLAFLAVLSVANATLTSVLERTRQFGVMLALGTRPAALVRLVMVEVALLGLVAVGGGAVVAAGIEAFGRIHGWPMALAGLDPRTLEELALSGSAEDTIFFARMPAVGAALIIGGVYVMFLFTGLWAALKVGRLEVLAALRSR